MLSDTHTARPVARVRPGPGQESVWDFPRPPAIETTPRHVEVVFAGRVIADTTRSLRVLETSHAPIYYIPIEDVADGVLVCSGHATYCEFEGEARYHDVRLEEQCAPDAAWTIDSPSPGYEALAGRVAFFPRLMDECRVDGEVVRPQPGTHYGGWITSDVVGPFKGEPGTSDW